MYKLIHTLKTNQSKRITADLFQRAVITAILCEAFLKHTALAELLTTDNEIDLLMNLIFRHLQTSSTNFHRMEMLSNARSMNNMDEASYGSGAYGFCSLFNHACAPNIVHLSIGRRIAVFVLKLIVAGEELLDNYG